MKIQFSFIYSLFICQIFSYKNKNSQETLQKKFQNKFDKLPERIIVGYPSNNECDEKIIQVVQDGVNVIIWFALNLVTNPQTKLPEIQEGPNMNCVANMSYTLQKMGLFTVHLVSIGGWNAPHVTTDFSVEILWNALDNWNKKYIQTDKNWYGFDGFDWDIEGNDNFDNQYNHFTKLELDIMGRLSQLAKQNGYIMSMAPPESYLDVTSNQFDLDLLHEYPEYDNKFKYHGHNVYAYLLVAYGNSTIDDNIVNTFDFVSIQLYETYSHAYYDINVINQPADKFLIDYILKLQKGWQINFENIPEFNLKNQVVYLQNQQIVIGLANGWGDKSKILMIPDTKFCQNAYNYLLDRGIQPRGFMYWTIQSEGAIPQGQNNPYWFAKEFNTFLDIRKTTTPSQ